MNGYEICETYNILFDPNKGPFLGIISMIGYNSKGEPVYQRDSRTNLGRVPISPTKEDRT